MGTPMVTGVLIAESLRVGATLSDLKLTIREIRRVRLEHPAVGQAAVWTLLDFEADQADAEELAQALSASLDEPGWYADFRSDRESWVVFPGRTFRYSRGDVEGRAAAAAHGRSLGIPESQLDWPV